MFRRGLHDDEAWMMIRGMAYNQGLMMTGDGSLRRLGLLSFFSYVLIFRQAPMIKT
jgi:hypothetical protein